MDQDLLQDFEGYEKLLGTLCRRWTPSQRTAFVSALAERWLPLYTRFSEAEDWGDPDPLRKALDAAWAHLAGETMDAPMLAQLAQGVIDVVPSMDDFDAVEPITASHLVGLAVQSCCPQTDWQAVIEAAGAAYSAVAEPVDGYPLNPNASRTMWRQRAVQAEISQQFRLMQQVTSVPTINRSVAEALRRAIRAAPGTSPGGER